MVFSKATKIKLNFGDIFVMILNEKNPSLSEEVKNRVSRLKKNWTQTKVLVLNLVY